MSNAEEKRHEVRHFAGLAFVACMFIGAGIGLLFGRPDVGGCIGMGVGFLLMGLIRVKGVRPAPVEVALPRSIGGLSLLAVGVIAVVAGVLMFINPKLLYPYLAGAAAIALGLLAISAGFLTFKKH